MFIQKYEFCFKGSPLKRPFIAYQVLKNMIITGFCMATDPDNNAENCARYSELLPNEENTSTLLIINLRKKSVFVSVTFSECKMIMCE